MLSPGAPPGFGKTALMKAAYERLVDGTLTLPGMRDTAVSHCSWFNASDLASPERFVGELRQSLGLAVMADTQNAMTDAMEAVARREGLTILFIDNVNEIDTGSRYRFLEQLILSAPDTLRIACSSCSPAQLQLSRLKARGVLTELAARELEFGRSDLRRLLARGAMSALVDPLMEITRGWPALAQLATGIVTGGPTEEERRLLLAGTHADLMDYTRETVINRLSPALLSTLRRLSPFSEFRLDLASDLGLPGLTEDDLVMLEALHPIIENGPNGWLSLHPVLRTCLERDTAFVSKRKRRRCIARPPSGLQPALIWNAPFPTPPRAAISIWRKKSSEKLAASIFFCGPGIRCWSTSSIIFRRKSCMHRLASWSVMPWCSPSAAMRQPGASGSIF